MLQIPRGLDVHSTRFPSHSDILPAQIQLQPFFEHWKFKHLQLQQFGDAWETAQAAILQRRELLKDHGAAVLLPSDVYYAWRAQWASSVIHWPIKTRSDQPAEAIREVDAIVDAIGVLTKIRGPITQAYLSEYPCAHCRAWPLFPQLKLAERERVYLTLVTQSHYDRDEWRTYPRLDADDFLERAAFLLQPTPPVEKFEWLTRLAIWLEPDQALWGDHSEFEGWARSKLAELIPPASRTIGIKCPPEVCVEDESLKQLLIRASNWVLDATATVGQRVSAGNNLPPDGGDWSEWLPPSIWAPIMGWGTTKTAETLRAWVSEDKHKPENQRRAETQGKTSACRFRLQLRVLDQSHHELYRSTVRKRNEDGNRRVEKALGKISDRKSKTKKAS